MYQALLAVPSGTPWCIRPAGLVVVGLAQIGGIGPPREGFFALPGSFFLSGPKAGRA